MVRTMLCRAACAMMLISLAVAATERPALGADGKMIRRGRRLPAYYAKVITKEQQEQIYKIQDEYRAKMEPLTAQLKALKKERDDKIAAVLTPEQKKQVEQAAAKDKPKPETPEQPQPAKPVE